MDNKKSNGHAAATVTALLEISNAVHSSENLSELFEKIHRTLKRIIDVSNFFIAIVDTKERTLHFPYYVDRFGCVPAQTNFIKNRRPPKTRKPKRGVGSGAPFLDGSAADYKR
jgi:transcriptional regulator with GAF, ATPase, and Fis domain